MKLERLSPGISVEAAMSSTTIKRLSPVEAIVYLRLLGLAALHRSIFPTNAELHRDNDATVRAVKTLASHGLIKIHRGKKIRELSRVGRMIEVL